MVFMNHVFETHEKSFCRHFSPFFSQVFRFHTNLTAGRIELLSAFEKIKKDAKGLYLSSTWSDKKGRLREAVGGFRLVLCPGLFLTCLDVA